MALQVAHVSKDRPELIELLTQAYDDIFVPAFTNPDARESLEKIISFINGEIPGTGIAVNLLGENLSDPAKRVLKGISIAYYYEAENVGLLAYNAISPQHRENGLGKLMVQSRIEMLQKMARATGRELEGVFIDVNDPCKVSIENDSIDPIRRVAIFEKWGARMVPIEYVQPPLEKDGYYCDTMRLMNYPIDGKYATKPAVENLLRAFYRESSATAAKPEDDFYFKKMKAELDNLPQAKPEVNLAPGYALGVPRFRYV